LDPPLHLRDQIIAKRELEMVKSVIENLARALKSARCDPIHESTLSIGSM
jgi:hypothetical protein